MMVNGSKLSQSPASQAMEVPQNNFGAPSVARRPIHRQTNPLPIQG